jgi:ribose transport system substrate-binding protein
MKKVFLWLLIISMVALFALASFTGLAAEQQGEKERLALAQKYKNAEPGEKFLVGHITFHLSQEYAMMVYQADEQACKQLGLKFIGALATTDEEWITTTESMIAAGAKAIIYNCPSVAVMPELARICNENNVFILTHF